MTVGGNARAVGSAGAHGAGLGADIRAVTGWTLVSRVTGFGRAAVMAAVLGPTYFGNLLQTAMVLPHLVQELLVGSLISALLVPALVRSVDARDQAASARIASGVLGGIILLSAGVVALAIAAGSLILDLVTMAVDEPEIRAEQQRLGWPILAIIMPQIGLYCVAGIGVAVQNAHGRFALATAAPAVENIVMILVLAASAALFGVGREVHDVETAQLLLLALGSTTAAAIHAGLQWWGASRAGVHLAPRATWRDPEVRRVFRLAVPSSGYTIIKAVTFFLLLVAAGSIPGGVVALQVAYSLFSLPTALSARPVATAQLPRLSRCFEAKDAVAFHETYRTSLALLRFVALPASLVFLAMPGSLARIVSFGEMASDSGFALVSAAIAGLGLGILGDGVMIVATSAAFARRDAVGPLQAAAIRAGITLGGIVLAFGLTTGADRLWALCLALSTANLVAAARLHWRHARAYSPLRSRDAWRLAGDVMTALAAVASGAAVASQAPGLLGWDADSLAAALLALAFSGALYLALQWARSSEELHLVLSRDWGRSRPAYLHSAPRAPGDGTREARS